MPVVSDADQLHHKAITIIYDELGVLAGLFLSFELHSEPSFLVLDLVDELRYTVGLFDCVCGEMLADLGSEVAFSNP